MEKRRKLTTEKIENADITLSLHNAVVLIDWEHNLISQFRDTQTLRDSLCVTMQAVWLLSATREEEEDVYARTTALVQKLLIKSADDGLYVLDEVVERSAFFAVSVALSRTTTNGATTSIYETLTLISKRLPERIEKIGYRDYRVRMAVGGRIQKYITSLLECKGREITEKTCRSSDAEVQLQLRSFKTFVDLAGNRITAESFTRALDVVFLTLIPITSRPLDSAIKGLVGILVERAKHIDEHFLDASVYGTPELVRIFLQMAPSNNLLLPANKALLFAAERGNIDIMDCLVDEGNAKEHWRCLHAAATGGCLPVVKWLVGRGCWYRDLIHALTGALRYGRVEMAAFLFPHVPRSFLRNDDIMELFINAALGGGYGSFPGLELLLHSNYLGDAAETYDVAMALARNNHLHVPGLHTYLCQNWTGGAFWMGIRQGRLHFYNVIRILKWGRSPLRLMDLPSALRVAIAYLPLYRECTRPGMRLLSQRQRGQLVVAAKRLGGPWLDQPEQRTELLAVLEQHLPPFFVHEHHV